MWAGTRGFRSRRLQLAGLVLAGSILAPAAHADPACSNGQPDAKPTGKGQQVLVDYFAAVNAKDYLTAWGYLGRQVRAMYGAASPELDADGLASYSSNMRRHMKCVRVTSIANAPTSDPDVSASLGIQWYHVTFDAEYLSRFDAGGTLPPFYKTQADPHQGAGPPPLIIGQATSP